MKKGKTVEVPVLRDIVVAGKEILPNKAVSPVLSDVQIRALEQQIEEIIQARLQKILEKATQAATVDMKTYLNEVLPVFLKELNRSDNSE
ncbi:MAG: hypothetical protein BWK79_01840 [Beggiatoa sp. IS2]|nr:MAG: hypothetical protein BWK79_01840 [Beggiatoa sp. IS2]